MNKIISLRGANGSGKSWLVRQLMKCYPFECVKDALRGNRSTERPLGYYNSSLNLHIVGDYRSHLTAPGCDALRTSVEEIQNDILNFWNQGHVLFEGVISATTYGRYADMIRSSLPSDAFVWVFLDTPLEECIRRIYQRNGGKPIKEDMVKGKMRQIASQPSKARAEGWRVYTLRHQQAWEDFETMMKNENILPTA